MFKRKITVLLMVAALVCQIGTQTAFGAEGNPFVSIELSVENGETPTYFEKAFKLHEVKKDDFVNTYSNKIKLTYTNDRDINYVEFLLKVTKNGEPLEDEKFEKDPSDNWVALTKLAGSYYLVRIQNPAWIAGDNFSPKTEKGLHNHYFLLNNIVVTEDTKKDTYKIEVTDDLEGEAEDAIPPVSGEISGDVVPVWQNGAKIEHVIGDPNKVSSNRQDPKKQFRDTLKGVSNVTQFMFRIANFSGTSYKVKQFSFRVYLLLSPGAGETVADAAKKLHQDCGWPVTAGGQIDWVTDYKSLDGGWMKNDPCKARIMPLDYPMIENNKIVANAYLEIELRPSSGELTSVGAGAYNKAEYTTFRIPNGKSIPLALHCDPDPKKVDDYDRPITELYWQESGEKVETEGYVSVETPSQTIKVVHGDIPPAVSAVFIVKLLQPIKNAALRFLPRDDNATGTLKLVEKGRFQAELELKEFDDEAIEALLALNDGDDEIDIELSMAGLNGAEGFKLVRIISKSPWISIKTADEHGQPITDRRTLIINARKLAEHLEENPIEPVNPDKPKNFPKATFVADIGTTNAVVGSETQPSISIENVRVLINGVPEDEPVEPDAGEEAGDSADPEAIQSLKDIIFDFSGGKNTLTFNIVENPFIK